MSQQPDPRTGEALVAAAALTQVEQWRQDQMELGNQAMLAFMALWPLFLRGLSTGNLAPWFVAVADVSNEYALAGWYASRERYEASRLQAGVAGRAPAFQPRGVDAPRLWGSLRKKLAEAKRRVEAGQQAALDDPATQVAMQQAVQRHVLEPGRALVHDAVEDAAALRAGEPGMDLAAVDRMLVGYMRTTDGDPCAFCAMLAARGAVYSTPDSALLRQDGEKYHDGCACLAVAVWTDSPPLPDINREMAALWRDAQDNPPPGERIETQGPRPGSDADEDEAGRRARNNFRRALNARRRAAGLPRR